MNIFAIEKTKDNQIDWVASAKSLDNYRVVKMILESTQMLCTTLNELEGRQLTPYKSTHKNHPCCKWLRESYYNFWNLQEHALSMVDEYQERFNKIHKCKQIILDCKSYALIYRFDKLWKKYDEGDTALPLCMPNLFKGEDVVESYRKYYASKERMRYPKNKIPKWFVEYRGELPFDVC